LLLDHRTPVSAQTGPGRVAVAALPPIKSEEEYLKGGRRSPFVPVAPVPAQPSRAGRPGTETTGAKIRAAGDDQQAQGGDKAAETDSAKPETKRPDELRFAGTVLVLGRSRALLRPKDGGPPLAVKPGDVISEYGCTVTRIEPQAIYLVNGKQRPVVLTDGR
jgi:hypothetical protein